MSIGKLYTIISTLTISEMKGRYRNTWAGFLWVILNPIIMFSVHALIFKHILKLDVDRYYVFLLGGLLPWIFISSTLNMTCNCFVTHREALLSFQIHPLALLASKVFDNFFNFIFPFLILFVWLYLQDGFPLIGIFSLPFSMILSFIACFILAVFFATLQVYFRDTQFILHFGLSIMYFLTPIFYPAEMVPQNLQWIIKINPIYLVIHPFQVALYHYDSTKILPALGESLVVILVFLILTSLLWRSKKNELYLYM